jgi:hypothetical protein
LEGSLDPQKGEQRGLHPVRGLQGAGASLLLQGLLHPFHPKRHGLKKANPDCNIVVLYRDMRTFSERELLWREAREWGLSSCAIPMTPSPRCKADGDKVVVYDNYLGRDSPCPPIWSAWPRP